MSEYVTLGEACASITYGVTASADFGDAKGPQLLRITDIAENGVNWGKVPRCANGEFNENDFLLRDGDIVVARTGGTVGKSFLVSTPPRAVNASYLLRLRPNTSIVVPDYLNLFLGSSAYWSQLREAARGAAQPNVNATTLSEISFPLPALGIQHQIAARLKAQLAEVETARQAAQAQMRDAGLLCTKIVDAAFDGFAEWRPIAEVAKVQSGYAFKSESFKTSGVRLLRNTNILPGKIYWDDAVYLDENEAGRYPAYLLEDGDVLISLDRPVISSGIKVARVGEADLPSLLLQRVGRFLLKPETIDADFLYAFLRSSRFIGAISGHDQSLGVPHISPGQVESVEMPRLSLGEQRRIVTHLKSQLAEAEAIAQAAAAQLAEIERLPQRILAQTFKDMQDAP